ncbi:MAG TPA: organomercurial lyase [Thermoanaerobaculia bacterium]
MDASEDFAREVRLHVFREAAATGRVPQPAEIAAGLERPRADVDRALKALAAGRVLILAPNDGNIWAANPFCAVPSPFLVDARDKSYWGICIWDALGILASLGSDGVVRTVCGDCSEPLELEVAGGRLRRSEGVVHFGVPAHRFWDNIGYT